MSDGHHLKITGGPNARLLRLELDGKPLKWVTSFEIKADAVENKPAQAVITLDVGILELDADVAAIVYASFQVVQKEVPDVAVR